MTGRLKAGSLFSGYGGLDLAVRSVGLMPTPRATDGPKGAVSRTATTDARVESGRASLSEWVLSAELAMLPTPQVADADGGHASRSGDRSGELLLPGIAREAASGAGEGGVVWGKYEDAVRRWESVTRAAPAPTLPDGRDGAHRLSPAFAEWMMGLPAGWVTDPELGLSRREQLKACGNGVVPQQAFAALQGLWARVTEGAA